MKTIGAVLGIIYGYGAFLGLLWLAWSWLTSRDIPRLEWWEFAAAPMLIGPMALALEAVGTFVTGGFTLGNTKSSLRLLAGKVAMVLILVALLLGLPLYHISRQ